MGKKRSAKSVEDEKPDIYCFYCDRDFEDEKVLILHQKAKHFKCDICHKKLSTAGGLVVHVIQVHKETIKEIPGALPERKCVEFDVYGMTGIPDDLLRDGAKVRRYNDSANSMPVFQTPPIPPPGSGVYFGAPPTGPLPVPYPQGAFPPPPPSGTLGMRPMIPMMPGHPTALPPPFPMPMAPPMAPAAPMYPPTASNSFPPAGGLFPRPPAPFSGHQLPTQQITLAGPVPVPFVAGATATAPMPPMAGRPSLVYGLQPGPSDASAMPSGSHPSAATVTVTAAPSMLAPGEAHLIWSDEQYSMEERRAMLPKYKIPLTAS